MSHKIPPSASVATKGTGEKLFAPSAARNVEAITQMLLRHVPNSGSALEIASGTGQHIVAFAAAMPQVKWHPTEVDPTRQASINAYVMEAGLENAASAQLLDASDPGWGEKSGPQDLVFLSNLLHLISTPSAQLIIAEAAHALAAGGKFVLYGPFKRDGVLTSEGDQRFDADLRAADPSIGYKDVNDVHTWITNAGLIPRETEHMPANNLALIATKP